MNLPMEEKDKLFPAPVGGGPSYSIATAYKGGFPRTSGGTFAPRLQFKKSRSFF